MWQIVKNEWQQLIRNRNLLFISTGFIALLIVSVILGLIEVNNQKKSFLHAKNHVREQWEGIKEMNPHNAAHYGSFIFKPYNILANLDEGVYSITGNVLRIEGHVQNEIIYSEASQVQTISKFGKLKSSLIFQYIIPILLIFLAFSSISTEKQLGRIKLLLLQGATTKQLVFGKTLAIWLLGICLLCTTILVYLTLNAVNLSPDILARTLFFLLAYSLYYFIITGLTVFFSAQLQNPTASLTAIVGIWIFWTLFLPQIVLSTTEKMHVLPTRSDMASAMKADRAKGIDGHNPSDAREKELEKQVLKKYKVDSLSQLPINFDGLVMQADEEYGNKVWDKHFGSLSNVLHKQKQTIQLFGSINPFLSLQNASMGFMASDNLHHQEFLKQAENYRRVFIKQLNDKHAYGGSKTGDWDWKANNAFFKSVPDFTHQPVQLTAVMSKYLTDLGFLFIWAGIVVILLILGAKKMQIL
ncbi:MAG: ABC transporter permease [Chitinophagaceae bacterium]